MTKSYPLHDPRNPEYEQMRKRVVRKLDWHVIPAVSLLYLACFLDRSNIGNAKVAGLSKDLDLTGVRFNLSLAIFYVTYVMVELPSNLLIRRFGAKNWLPLLVFCWGFITIMTGFIKNFASLLAIRLLLGFFEGGLLPGIVIYLSCIYRKDELQLRIAILFSFASWSGAFGGLLAYAIERLNGVGGKPSWAWIFIIEGLGTLLVAAFARFSLFSNLSSATFLSPAEKEFAENRLNVDVDSWRQPSELSYESKQDNLERSKGTDESAKSSELGHCPAVATEDRDEEKFEWFEVWRGVLEPQVWVLGLAALFTAIAGHAYTFFLPTLVKEMGHDRVHTQLLSAYPHLPAAVLVIIVAVLADKWQIRGPLALVCLPLSIAGYSMTSTAQSTGIRYAGVFFMTAGFNPAMPCFFTIISNNASGITKRATVTALLIMITNLSGFISPWLYTQDQAPRFVKGHRVSLAFICASWILTLCNVLYCWRENVARKAGHRDYAAEKYRSQFRQQKTQAPIGDRDPQFRFTL